MNGRTVVRAVLHIVHESVGGLAWLLRVRTPRGRWRASSNRHSYLEST
jgi:hypothetical protein